MPLKRISIIVPVYNEEKNVNRAYETIVEEFQKHPHLEYEFIFTDNHSTDKTFEKLSIIASTDPNVCVLRFARNFGFQRSILTGYRHATGDAAVQIDCDLEDPPSIISKFIDLWQQGHDVVIGLRTQRTEHLLLVKLRRLYYKLLDKISDVPHAVDAGDFRLVDKAILEQLRSINDMQPYVRGLISELAKNQIGVSYIRQKREFGESKFPIKQLIKLALEGIFSYSVIPLRIASYLGILTAIVTAVTLGTYICLHQFFGHQWPEGFTTLAVLVLFGISINALFLGIIGEYIGRIYNQLRIRPLVVIEKALNIKSGNRVSATYKQYPQKVIITSDKQNNETISMKELM